MFFREWRSEGATEIVAYAHGGVALALSAALIWAFGVSVPFAFGAWLGAFFLLMGCVRHRYLVWLAALLGTGVTAACFGGLGWVLAHASVSPNAPLVGTVAGALLGGGIAVPAYVRLLRDARLRGERSSWVPSSV